MIISPSDESAHSFILRHHIVYGVSDVSNIVSQSGYWVRQPGVLDSTVHLYQQHEEHHLLVLVMNSNFVKETRAIFSNPQYFLSRLNETFYKGKGASQQSGYYTIKFCPDCIRAQIREFGFGYFKACWLRSDFCVQHHLTLRNVDYPLSNPYDYLQKILSGHFPARIHSHEIRRYHVENTLLKFAAKASPCLAEIFQKWIRKRLHLIDEKVAGECGVNDRARVLVWLLHDDGRFRNAAHVHLGLILKAIQKVYSDHYLDFINTHSKTIIIPCGIKYRETVFIPFMVHNENDCQKCLEINCVASCSIPVVCSIVQQNLREEMNLCDKIIYRENIGQNTNFFFSNRKK